MKIEKSLKMYFFRGMAVLLPTILTIWMIIWGYKFIHENISVYINRGLVRLIMVLQGQGGASQSVLEDIWVTGAGSIAGFIIALVAVCMVGMILASMIGKTIWRMIERFIMVTPLVKQLYPYVKQVTDFIFKEDGKNKAFSKVVAVEWPRRGMWSVGFVTGSGLKKVADHAKTEMLTVFVPSTPTPATGFITIVPKEQTIDLDITVEEACGFIFSGGVITPKGELILSSSAADIPAYIGTGL